LKLNTGSSIDDDATSPLYSATVLPLLVTLTIRLLLVSVIYTLLEPSTVIPYALLNVPGVNANNNISTS
jgi:hypothetical protein